MPNATPPARVVSLTPHLYLPTPGRPVRAKRRWLAADTEVLPHSHPWAQVAYSDDGVIRLTAAHGAYIVPPTRAVWIPPGVEHAVAMVEDAHLLTLYIHAEPRSGAAAQPCRVLEVSDLLRALARELDTTADTPEAPHALPPAALRRERRLCALVIDELRRARTLRLGLPLPRDKRLRTLCEAVLADPTRHATLAAWARDTGASPRTVARLFRQELSSTFTQWRQQAVLAQAVSLAARRLPTGRIAAELGYSASAFSAMVRRTVGMPPGRFFGQQGDISSLPNQ